MKRILLSLFAVALAVVLKGQTFSVTPSDTIHYTLHPSHGAEIYFHFQNISAQPLTLRWSRLGGSYSSHWTMLLCDNKECFSASHPGDTMNTVVPGDSAFFKLICAPNDTPGVGTLDLRVWDTLNPSSTVDVHYIINATTATAVANPSLSQTVVVFPTIARESIHIQAKQGLLEKGKVSLYDTKGHLQLSQPVNPQRTVQIALGQLAPGIYLMRYECRSGQLTQKVMVER